MTMRNPIYQAMLRTKAMDSLMRAFEQSPGSKPLFDQLHNEMSAIRNMRLRGVLSDDLAAEVSRKAVRSIHAHAILSARKKSTFSRNRRFVRVVLGAYHEGVR